VWEYQSSNTKQWIWWKGTSSVNQPGQYLTNGIPYVNNVVGGRRGTAIWPLDVNACTSSGNCYFWLFGGEGYDSTSGAPPGYLDDLWTYLPFP